MKKILALVLALAMVATFAACGGGEETPATAEYKLGMGISVSLDSSADAADDKNATAQADATVAVVVLDKDGKIVAADLDCAQTKVEVKDGKIVDVDKVDVRTKKEKKEDYNMKGVSASMGTIEGGAEWYEQAAAFAEKMVGKTVADLEALTTEEKNGHQVSTDADLYAVCTMDITAFKAAFVAACKDAQAKTFTAGEGFKLGLDVETDVSGSADAKEDALATAQLYSTFGATVVDADGKVLAAIVDEIQPKVTVAADNKIADKTYSDTKRNLKEGYNMKGVSASMGTIEGGAEWYEQAEAFTDKMVGKTGAEIKALETEVKNDHNVAKDADIYAVCTMQISGYQVVLSNAADAAK